MKSFVYSNIIISENAPIIVISVALIISGIYLLYKVYKNKK
ncbi:MAG: hypothetical protein ACK5LC_07005 [Coprobacillaceae bacterium]